MGGCGGALITPDTVLFAAHCGDYTGASILIGAYTFEANSDAGNGTQRFCDKWVKSPIFDTEYRHDVALCKLNEPVYINKSVTKLVLNNDPNIPTVDDGGIGDDLIAMGFGLDGEGGTLQQTLRDVTVPYVSNTVCQQNNPYPVYPDMLCAGKYNIYVTLHNVSYVIIV